MLRRVVRHTSHCYVLCLSYSSWRLSTAGRTAVSMICTVQLEHRWNESLQWEDDRPQHMASHLDHVQPPNVFVSEEEVPSPHHSYLRPQTTRHWYRPVLGASDARNGEAIEVWGADVRCVPAGELHMQSNNICYYQWLSRAVCPVWTVQRQDWMLSLFEWY